MDYPAGLYIETHLSNKPSITENSIRALVSAIRGGYATKGEAFFKCIKMLSPLRSLRFHENSATS
jgi:hypothetical protein